MKSQNLKNYYIPNNHSSTLQRPTSMLGARNIVGYSSVGTSGASCSVWCCNLLLIWRAIYRSHVCRPWTLIPELATRGGEIARFLPFLHLRFRTNGVKHTARLAQADRMSGWCSMGGLHPGHLPIHSANYRTNDPSRDPVWGLGACAVDHFSRSVSNIEKTRGFFRLWTQLVPLSRFTFTNTIVQRSVHLFFQAGCSIMVKVYNRCPIQMHVSNKLGYHRDTFSTPENLASFAENLAWWNMIKFTQINIPNLVLIHERNLEAR